MAVMTQSPCRTKFVGDMRDMILSSADSLDFRLLKGAQVILTEHYAPADGTIRVGGLWLVIDSCLYGELKLEGGQSFLAEGFTFQWSDDDGETWTDLLNATLFASHRREVSHQSRDKNVFSHGQLAVCYPGVPHPLTFAAAGQASLVSANGTVLATSPVGSGMVPYTTNCDPALLFPGHYQDGAEIRFTCGGDTFRSLIDHSNYRDKQLLRFLNLYDAPEVLVAKVATQVKPQWTEEIGTTYGEDRKYSVAAKDEYTVNSGILATSSEYLHWHDLLLSRRVEVLVGTEWLPVIVTKSNYTQEMRSGSVANVFLTYRFA